MEPLVWSLASWPSWINLILTVTFSCTSGCITSVYLIPWFIQCIQQLVGPVFSLDFQGVWPWSSWWPFCKVRKWSENISLFFFLILFCLRMVCKEMQKVILKYIFFIHISLFHCFLDKVSCEKVHVLLSAYFNCHDRHQLACINTVAQKYARAILLNCRRNKNMKRFMYLRNDAICPMKA